MARFTRNIDRAGRWARGISGVLFLVIAFFVLLRGIEIGGVPVRWTIGIVSAIFGIFQVFEALVGWCVMRALGFRTPM